MNIFFQTLLRGIRLMFEVVRGRTKFILAAFRRSPPPSKGGTHIFTFIIPFVQRVHLGRNMWCYTMPGEILAFVHPCQINGSVRFDAYSVSLEELTDVVFWTIFLLYRHEFIFTSLWWCVCWQSNSIIFCKRSEMTNFKISKYHSKTQCFYIVKTFKEK